MQPIEIHIADIVAVVCVFWSGIAESDDDHGRSIPVEASKKPHPQGERVRYRSNTRLLSIEDLEHFFALEASVTTGVDPDGRELSTFAPSFEGQCRNPKKL
jgi:hypothetical protein